MNPTGEPGSTRPRSGKSLLEPVGVGGWLLLLVVALAVVIPAYRIAILGQSMLFSHALFGMPISNFAWLQFKFLAFLLNGAAAWLCIHAGVGLLRKRTPGAVHRAKLAIWLAGPAATAADLFLVPFWSFGGIDISDHDLALVLIAMIPAGIGNAYLSLSRRVANTYCAPGR